MANEEVRQVVQLIQDARVGMLTSHGDGSLLSRPLTVIDVTEDGDLWFFSTQSSDVVREVETDPEVNVSFAQKKSWVSLSGQAQIVREIAKKKELWNTVVEAFATDGPESPNTVLIHVAADSAEYWENPGGVASFVMSWVQEKIGGEPQRPGTSNTVEL